MYIKTKQAACWVGGPADATRGHSSRPPRIQRWADRPLVTPNGTIRAIRFDGEEARVLVERSGRRHWLPICHVMSEAQARRWVKTSFTRSR